MIRGQCIHHSASPHKQNTDGVAERPIFIGPMPQKSQSLVMQLFIHPTHLQLVVIMQVQDEFESGGSRCAACVCQRNEFSKDVVVCESRGGSVVESLRVSVSEIAPVKKAHEAGCVQKHLCSEPVRVAIRLREVAVNALVVSGALVAAIPRPEMPSRFSA